jgi:hypothetical protein
MDPVRLVFGTGILLLFISILGAVWMVFNQQPKVVSPPLFIILLLEMGDGRFDIIESGYFCECPFDTPIKDGEFFRRHQ